MERQCQGSLHRWLAPAIQPFVSERGYSPIGTQPAEDLSQIGSRWSRQRKAAVIAVCAAVALVVCLCSRPTTLPSSARLRSPALRPSRLYGEFPDVSACKQENARVSIGRSCCENPSGDLVDPVATHCGGTISGGDCKHECVAGYYASAKTTCDDGKWGEAACSPVPCSANPDIHNMDRDATDCGGTKSGESCEIKCMMGHEPTGNSFCERGHWSGARCEAGVCGADLEIPHVDNKRSNCAGTLSGDQCEFKCLPGYEPSGVASCELGIWDEGHTCDPLPCGDLEVDKVDTKAVSCNGTASGNKCSFACLPGFRPSGPAQCTAGAWDNQTCDPQPCDEPPRIASVDHVSAARCVGTPPGTSCNITCLEGFSASASVLCVAGTWAQNVSCDASPCNDEPPIPHLDGISSRCSGTEPGGRCAYVCQPGFHPHQTADPLDPGAEVMCVNGAWNHERYTCEPDSCENNPDVFHLDHETTDCRGLLSGTSCQLSCKLGFSPSGEAVCSNGKWRQPLPRCEPQACESQPNITNIDSVASPCLGTKSGDYCSYKCVDGYEPSGEVPCQTGKWQVDECDSTLEGTCWSFSCDPSPCKTNPPWPGVDDGLSRCHNTASGKDCQFRCYWGFSPARKASCLMGSWGNSSSCQPSPCKENPTTKFLDSDATHCQDAESGAKCAGKCLAGYTLSGAFTCLHGEWDTQSCEPVGCLGEPNIPHMDHKASTCNGTAIGRTCAFKCEEGYAPLGQVTCEDGGKWGEQQCGPAPCASNPTYDNIDDEASECEGTESGATCHFQCNIGFTPSGVAICDGSSWNSQSCDADCTDEPVVEGLDPDATACGGTSSGSTCTVQCLHERPSADVTCSKGVWLRVDEACRSNGKGHDDFSVLQHQGESGYTLTSGYVIPSSRAAGQPQDEQETVMNTRRGKRWCDSGQQCTIKDAKSFCTKHSWCVGFSFNGPTGDDATPMLVVFKGYMPDSLKRMKRWNTFVKKGSNELS